MIADKLGIPCLSSRGKSGVLRKLDEHADKKAVVIADGAAFGSEIEDIVKQQVLRPNRVGIYLPESFEWIVLSSGVVSIDDKDSLDYPEEYADSVDYMSWEQYFTELLIEVTKELEYKKYKKDYLVDFYCQERVERIIKGFIKGIDFS